MAQVQMPIVKKVSGRLGNVVFYMYHDKIFMRTLPFNCKVSKSPAQLKQRLKFSLIIDIDRYLRKFTRMGFPESVKQMSQYNAFVKANIKKAFTGSYPDMAIDYTKLVVSHGSLNGGSGFKVFINNMHSVSIEWMDNSGVVNADSTDRAMVLLINPTRRQIITDTTSRSRKDKGITIELPDFWENEEVYAYLSFRTESGDKTSESVYLDKITITGNDDSVSMDKQNCPVSMDSVTGAKMKTPVNNEEQTEVSEFPFGNKQHEKVPNIKIHYLYKEAKCPSEEEFIIGTSKTSIPYSTNISTYDFSISCEPFEKKQNNIAARNDSEMSVSDTGKLKEQEIQEVDCLNDKPEKLYLHPPQQTSGLTKKKFCSRKKEKGDIPDAAVSACLSNVLENFTNRSAVYAKAIYTNMESWRAFFYAKAGYFQDSR